jgi:DNA-binding MarR family transcriptional regulator
MEDSSLIKRDPDPRDARSTFATITPKGRELVTRARASHHRFLQRVFGDALGRRDADDLARIMRNIHDAIERL